MLIIDMPMPKVCITKDGYYGNCPMDRVWCIQGNAPSGITMGEAYAEMTENIPSWCPIKGELVRCGECMFHSEPRRTDMGVNVVWCNFYNTHKIKDGYCNCGERKDGEHGDLRNDE